MQDTSIELHAPTLVALADAPARTGTFISEALAITGKSWGWFETWIKVPGHLAALLALAKDAVTKDWASALKDAAALFSN